MGRPQRKNADSDAFRRSSRRRRHKRRKKITQKVRPEDVPFLAALDAYLEYRDREAWITRDYSAANTQTSYYYRLKALCAFMAAEQIRDARSADLDALDPGEARKLIDEAIDGITLDDFHEDTVREYLYFVARKDGISARTRNARLYSFRPFFRWIAETYDDESLDVCAEVEKSQVQPQKRRGVTEDHWNELNGLLESRAESTRHGMRDRILFKAMRYFGRRVSEIAALNRGSIYEQRDSLVIEYVGKGNKRRSKRLPLYTEAGALEFAQRFRGELSHYRTGVLSRRYTPSAGHEQALFLSQKHQRITVRQVERIFKNLMKILGLSRLGYTPHSVRHGFARAKLDDGVGLRQLQRLLDHASIRTTEVYLDADEEELTEAMGRGVTEDHGP